MKKHFIYISLIFLSFVGFGQQRKKDFTEDLKDAFDLLQSASTFEEKAQINKKIAIIYFRLNDGKKSLKYIDAAIDNGIQSKNDTLLAKLYNNKGIIFTIESKWDSCMFYAEESLRIKKHIGDIKGIHVTYHNMGSILLKKGQYDKAQQLYTQSLEYSLKNNLSEYLATNFNNIGRVFLKRNQFDSASYYYHEALKNAKLNQDAFTEKKALKNLEALSINQQNFEKAYEYLQEHTRIWDSLYTHETKVKIAELELNQKTQEQEHFIALQNAKLKRNRIIFIVLILLLAVFLFLIYFYRKLHVQKKSFFEKETRIKREAFLNYIKGQEMERMRIALDFHTNMNHTLCGARITTEDKDFYVSKAQELLDDTADEVFSIVIEQFGIYGAIANYVLEQRAKGIEIYFTSNLEKRSFPHWSEASIYKIVLGLSSIAIEENAKDIHLHTGIVNEKIHINIITEKHTLNIEKINLIAASLITLFGAELVLEKEVVTIDVPMIVDELKNKRISYELANR